MQNESEPFDADQPSDAETEEKYVRPRPVQRKRSILMAGMLGLYQALGWENHQEKTVQIVNAPGRDNDLDLDYGPLESLVD